MKIWIILKNMISYVENSASVFYLQPEGYEGVSVYGGGYGGVENSGSTSFSKVL